MGLIVLGILIGWAIEWLFFNFYLKGSQNNTTPNSDAEIEQLQRKLAEKDTEISSLKSEISSVVAGVKTKPAKKKSTSKAKKTPASVSFEKEMQNISGIGPKISNTLMSAGIDSYQKLAGTKVEEITEILSKSGTKYAMIDVSSWPQQASLLNEGDTAGFEKLVKTLKK